MTCRRLKIQTLKDLNIRWENNLILKSKDDVLQVHHIESRKTGGNAPNNLVTLCKTCHEKYHSGEITLNVNRGKSFRLHVMLMDMST